MSRNIIKEDEIDREWNSGVMLKENQRFQTDAEWHGETLEQIVSGIETTNDNLSSLADKIDCIEEHLQKIADTNQSILFRYEGIKPQNPMPTWRFIFSWICFLLATGMIVEALI